MSEKQISKEIKCLEKLMIGHVKNLEFEKAPSSARPDTCAQAADVKATVEDNVASMLGNSPIGKDIC